MMSKHSVKKKKEFQELDGEKKKEEIGSLDFRHLEFLFILFVSCPLFLPNIYAYQANMKKFQKKENILMTTFLYLGLHVWLEIQKYIAWWFLKIPQT